MDHLGNYREHGWKQEAYWRELKSHSAAGGSDVDQVGCGTQWSASGICFEVGMDRYANGYARKSFLCCPQFEHISE